MYKCRPVIANEKPNNTHVRGLLSAAITEPDGKSSFESRPNHVRRMKTARNRSISIAGGDTMSNACWSLPAGRAGPTSAEKHDPGR
jgi:hypothetical protein